MARGLEFLTRRYLDITNFELKDYKDIDSFKTFSQKMYLDLKDRRKNFYMIFLKCQVEQIFFPTRQR